MHLQCWSACCLCYGAHHQLCADGGPRCTCASKQQRISTALLRIYATWRVQCAHINSMCRMCQPRPLHSQRTH
jgi:hypothetical protein